MKEPGRSLELFFVDGRPDGMVTAEMFNWTGHVLRAPRTQMKAALQRPEASFTGVYLLSGEINGELQVYIGEAETLGSRIKDHIRGKGWWDTAVFITTTANNLHKAHIKYLESRLVQIGRSLGKCVLDNGNLPPLSSLNEASTANMESFLNTLDVVLPAIGVEVFHSKSKPVRSPTASIESTTSPTFVLESEKMGVSAKAQLLDGEWLVLQGSQARKSWVGDLTNKTSYWKLHAELIRSGTLAVSPTNAEFVTDYAFSSPSAAAAVVSGRSTNGRTAWRHKTSGITYAEWEEQEFSNMEFTNDHSARGTGALPQGPRAAAG